MNFRIRPKVRRTPTDGGRSTNGRHNIDLTSFALRRSSRLRHSSPRRQLLPQPNLSAAAAAALARPPASPCSSCSCRHSAAAKWPSTARADEAEASETERGNANPMIPSMLYQQRAQSKRAKNVAMHNILSQGCICVKNLVPNLNLKVSSFPTSVSQS